MSKTYARSQNVNKSLQNIGHEQCLLAGLEGYIMASTGFILHLPFLSSNKNYITEVELVIVSN